MTSFAIRGLFSRAAVTRPVLTRQAWRSVSRVATSQPPAASLPQLSNFSNLLLASVSAAAAAGAVSLHDASSPAGPGTSLSDAGSGTSQYHFIADAAEKAAPAVVNILAQVRQMQGFQQRVGAATGSGFIVSDSGLIVTNAHVVSGPGGGARDHPLLSAPPAPAPVRRNSSLDDQTRPWTESL